MPVFGQQLGFALEQINGHAIINAGLTGKGVKVGIIDGGFLNADKEESLAHFFQEGLIEDYKDYLDPEAENYDGSKALDDMHGTEVWQLIGGLSKRKQVQYGLATGAAYYLARTDHGGYERREEEQFAIEAMEWMAGQGVKIINLSLGYNFGYTNKQENYKPSQIDGKSTIVTQAVDRLSKSHGILFIVAAGNDGGNKWEILGSPGDAQTALTVGATKLKIWDNMNYSSTGPKWLPYVKPEISCFATSGTSFSTPIITGLAACLLEQKPSLSGAELKDLLIKSSNLKYPNNYIGYGVPNAQVALEMIEGKDYKDVEKIKVKKNNYVFNLPDPSIYVAVYHKVGWNVIEKEILRFKKSKVKIKRFEKAESSTIIWEGGNLEIEWID